jgi:hypothetical protein
MTSLQQLFNEFIPRLLPFGKPVLAGGAVRDTIMGKEPKDWDVFILRGQENWNFEAIAEQIKPALSSLTKIEPVVSWHRSEPYLVATVKWKEAIIQVLVNPALTMEELIATFDWNVCLFAHDGERALQGESIENIGPGKELHLKTVTFPLSTLRRGFRFSERFKMKLLRDDVLTLCKAIIKNADAHTDIGPTGNEPDMPALAANLLIDERDPYGVKQ